MSTSEAVTGAIALLRRRHDELGAMEERIRAEKREIEGALTSLGAPVTDPPSKAQPKPEPSPAKAAERAQSVSDDDDAPSNSVRAIVERTLNGRDHAFTNNELVQAVRAIRDDLTDEQIRKNVRSALWLLRKNGTIGDGAVSGTKIATKWLTDAEGASADTEAPSVPAPTITEEGGGEDGGDGDHNDLYGRIDHHHHRASIT